MLQGLGRLFTLARQRIAGSGLTSVDGTWRAAWKSHPVTAESLATERVGIDRQVGGIGELGMGGPSFWTMLLADGALLHGVCGPVRDLPASTDGGALRLALTQSREGLRLQVYDIDAQVIHLVQPRHGQLSPEALDDLAVKSPTKAGAPVRAACRHAAESVALEPVCGLRLPRDTVRRPEPLLVRQLSSGRRLEARCLLPADLRATLEVDRLLSAPPYALWLDDTPTGLHVGDLDEVVEGASGHLVLAGHRLDAHGRVTDGLWLAYGEGRWNAVAGQAYQPMEGGGARTPYFLSAPLIDDDCVSFALRTFSWGPEGEMPSEPVPPEIELGVSWRSMPLRLATAAGRVTLSLPRGDRGA